MLVCTLEQVVEEERLELLVLVVAGVGLRLELVEEEVAGEGQCQGLEAVGAHPACLEVAAAVGAEVAMHLQLHSCLVRVVAEECLAHPGVVEVAGCLECLG